MADTAWQAGLGDRRCTFEVFTRRTPPGGHGVISGVDRICTTLEELSFTTDELDWMWHNGVISDTARNRLEHWTFDGDVDGHRDGERFNANEPVLRVTSGFATGTLVETIVLSILNAESAVASTAARIRAAAHGRQLIDMGTRRVHDAAAVDLVRAAWVGGIDATSNLAAGRRYGIPTAGTAAHASILLSVGAAGGDTTSGELDAFRRQLAAARGDTTLLIDTFDTVNGARLAVRAAQEAGMRGPAAVRIDSGDLADITRQVRAVLDELGAHDTRIVVSGDLDRDRIAELADAPIDTYGVGTRLLTAEANPTCGFVYKLVAVADDDNENWTAVAKHSTDKTSRGGRKHVVAVDDPASGQRNHIVVDDNPGTVHEHIAGTRSGSTVDDVTVPHMRNGRRTTDSDPETATRQARQLATRRRNSTPTATRTSNLTAGQDSTTPPDKTPAPQQASPQNTTTSDMTSTPPQQMTATQHAEHIITTLDQQGRRRSRGLLVVDAQQDFCDDIDGAPLGVNGAGRAVDVICELLARRHHFDVIAVSQDWHIAPGDHWSDTPDYANTWPTHCAAGTPGAELHPRLLPDNFTGFDITIRKGQYDASYSAFDANAEISTRTGDPVCGGVETALHVHDLVVVGIATDHCVAATVIDAARAGYQVTVPLAATAAVGADQLDNTITRMRDAGNVHVFGDVANNEGAR